MTRLSFLLLFALGLIVVGCTVGPDYRRPDVSVPPAFRGVDGGTPAPTAASFGDLAWWQLFDPSLTDPTDTLSRMPTITRSYGITPQEPCA